MFDSRSEIVAWVLAILVIAAMGIITFTGPYHKINKVTKAAAADAHPVKTVKILTDPKTTGRYNPSTVTVSVGQSVQFTNVSNLVHTVTADNHSFDSGDIQNSGKSWTYFASQPGTYKYFCIYHPYMKGTIVVRS